MKHIFLALLTAFALSTLRASDASTKAAPDAKPLVEKLANSRWGMDSDSKMDPKLAWFILNPDKTVRSGWRKELGWWKAQGDASIEAQVTNKNVTRVLTFNKDLSEATDQLNRKYRRLDKPAATTAGGENASTIQNPPQAPDFQTIAANRKLWPLSVVLKAATAVPIILNGQSVGSITIPAGASVQVVSVNTNGELVVAQNGNQTKVLAQTTNFAEAYAVKQTKLAESKATEEVNAAKEATQRAENERKASLQKQLAAVSQRPPAGDTSTPGVHVMRVSGKVLQVRANAFKI